MKGVILAGGLGTRLRPLTEVLNKHLLPVYDMPMLYYPLDLMRAVGIKDIMIVVGGHGMEQVVKQVKDGKNFGFDSVTYAYQHDNGGIAAALKLAKDFVGHDLCLVVLGDNILLGNQITRDQVHWAVSVLKDQKMPSMYGCVWLSTVAEPENYGCPQFSQDGTSIVNIDEKPKDPASKFAVIGVYLYNALIFAALNTLKVSARGELEISDLNNMLAGYKRLIHCTVQPGQLWADAGGSCDELLRTSAQVKLFREKERTERTVQFKASDF